MTRYGTMLRVGIVGVGLLVLTSCATPTPTTRLPAPPRLGRVAPAPTTPPQPTAGVNPSVMLLAIIAADPGVPTPSRTKALRALAQCGHLAHYTPADEAFLRDLSRQIGQEHSFAQQPEVAALLQLLDTLSRENCVPDPTPNPETTSLS